MKKLEIIGINMAMLVSATCIRRDSKTFDKYLMTQSDKFLATITLFIDGRNNQYLRR